MGGVEDCEPLVEGGAFFSFELFNNFYQCLFLCFGTLLGKVVQGLDPKHGIYFGAVNESPEDAFAEWKGCEFLWRDRHRMILESGGHGLPSVGSRKFKVFVLGMFAYLFDHCDRDRGISPGGRDNGFKANLGMLVVC